MRDLSLHLLDLCQNSIKAEASLIEIGLHLSGEGILTLSIKDDGQGMDEASLARAHSPFGTSRTTRKVGLGIPLTEEHARATGGGMTLSSLPGKGTELSCRFDTRHLDCPPLGNLAETMATLILANPKRPDFTLTVSGEQGTQTLDTREIRKAVGDLPLDQAEVMQWLISAVEEMTQEIFGGKLQ